MRQEAICLRSFYSIASYVVPRFYVIVQLSFGVLHVSWACTTV